ncbi:MAG: methyltransferase domain-containing protein [Acidobacteria bacterium]|nr:methyltransferase domain-containing protein [Acidobacteriota bacterium]
MSCKQIILLILTTVWLLAQGTHPVSGRKIAPVMGVGGADWLVRPERELEENPDLALKLLDIPKGAVVADLGAGVGYYSLKIARIVGSGGKVYATDIQPEMLRLLRKRAEKEGVRNVETVLGGASATNLPDNSIDIILLVDVYHEFSEPQKMLASIAAAMKDNGRLVLLEFREEDPRVPIRPEHKMSQATVTRELEAEGYEMEKSIPGLPWQHILVFRKRR